MTSGAPRSQAGNDDNTSTAVRRSRLSVVGWVKCLVARKAQAESVLPDTSPRGPVQDASPASLIAALSREVECADETARTAVEGLRARRMGTVSPSGANPSPGAIEKRIPPAAQPSERGHRDDNQAGLEAIKAQLRALLAAQPGQQPDRTPDADLLSHGQQKISESVEALQGQVTVLGDRLSALDTGRLGAIEQQMDAIRGELEAAKSQNGVARLEMRIAELARAVDAALAAAKAALRPASLDSVSRLENRVDNVIARLDRLIDGSLGGEVLEAMHADIGKIRETLADRDPLAALEAQIAELSGRLDPDRSVPVTGLEETVSRLGLELERAIPRLAGFEAFEASVRKSHERMAESLRESVEMARAAAREVAEKVGGGDLAGAVKRDLGDLRRTADAADARTQQALRSIEGTLAQVVERLGRLEAERDDEETPALEALKATGTYGGSGGRSLKEAEPSATRSSWQRMARSGAMESTRPDLAALRELARSATRGEHGDPTDRKADFIAAARRAAKAAAERKGSAADTATGGGKVEALGRIGQAVLGRGRTVAATAAGLMIALAAIHLADRPPADARSAVERAERNPDPVSGDGNRRAERAVVEQSRHADAQPKSPSAATAFAFAAPEHIGGRFDKAPAAPPTHAFVRGGGRAAQLPLDDAIGPADLRRAAAAGNPNAVVAVAARYAEGRVVPRDLAKAIQWYRLAAEQGVAVAQYRLASLYERGQGVAQDREIAAGWYRRAAEQGNTGAMHNLGVVLSEGVAGGPDYAEAIKWFRAAADRGVADSQFNLGVVYARGLGTARNPLESHKWFALAARGGDVAAEAQRDRVTALLSSGERARAREAVANWQVTPEKKQANQLAALPDAWRDAAEGITDAQRLSLVVRIQTLLAEQGYDPGPPDGLEGPMTRQAVLAFQRNTGLSETGAINSDVVAALANTPG